MKLFIQRAFTLVAFFQAASSIDLWASNIYTVTNGTRYTSLHPNIALRPFEKVLHIKENVIFVTGERIEGK